MGRVVTSRGGGADRSSEPPSAGGETRERGRAQQWIFRLAATAVALLAIADSGVVLLRPRVHLLQYAESLVSAGADAAALAGWIRIPWLCLMAVALAAGMLALLLTWRADDRPEARALALFLGLVAVTGDAITAAGLPPEAAEVATLLNWLAVAAFVRFVTLFPRRLRPDDLEPASGRSRRGAIRRIGRRLAALAGRADRPVQPPPAASRLWLDPRAVWGVWALVGALVTYAARPQVETVVEGLASVLVVGVLVQSARFLRIGFQRASPERRQSTLWLVQAVFATFWIFVLTGLSTILVHLPSFPEAATERVAMTVLLVGFTLGAAVLLAGVTAAVFYHGALHPSLALRKTALYGLLTTLLMAVFVSIEFGITSMTSRYLGAGERYSALFAGVGSALAFELLYERVKRRTNEFFDRVLPVTLLMEEGDRDQAAVVAARIPDFEEILRRDEERGLVLARWLILEAGRATRNHGGRVALRGQGILLMEFADIARAREACRILLEATADPAGAAPGNAAGLALGLAHGRIVRDRDGAIFGLPVEAAIRLATAAEPGKVPEDPPSA